MSRVQAGRRLAPITRAVWRDQGRPAVAVLMACLTFLGAAVAALQSDASTISARSARAADAASMQQLGFDARAHVGTLRDNAAFREWFAVLEESAWAGTEVPGIDEAEASYRADLRQIDADLAEWIRTRSALLQAPYFDEATYLVDFNAYGADTRQASLLATERARAGNEVADAWQSKANSYVTILTTLAVAVFFLGLAGTVATRARGILIATGVLLGGVALLATVALATGPVRVVPEEAISAIVRSQTELERAGNGDPVYLSETTRPIYASSIAQAASAVRLDPLNVAAHRAEASANLFFANARIFAAEGPSADTDALLRVAIRAYERAVELDPTDPSTWWNLGFSLYLVGDAGASIGATQEVIDRTPNQFVPYVNRAVAEAAAGRRDAADRSIEEAVVVAASTNLATNGFFFGRVDADLARLADLRPAEADWLRAAQRRLREARVSIRVNGHGNPDPTAPGLGAVQAAGMSLEADGSYRDQIAIRAGGTVERTKLVGLRLTIPGSPDLAGRRISIRVWTGDASNAGLSREIIGRNAAQRVELVDPYGRAGFELTPGRWLIEIYVDGATRASLAFEVRATG